MNYLPSIARAFFGISIAGIGVQQFIYAAFRPVILPPWPSFLHGSAVAAYLIGAILVVTGLLIASGWKTVSTAIFLGGLLLLFFFAFHVVYLLFFGPHSPRHFGLWTDPLKESALAGGAFVVAGFFSPKARQAKLLIRGGSILFAITMIIFGIDHFLYTEFVATLVPAWIPGKVFWTYFGAVALIGSGLAILLGIALRAAALLLSVMLMLWVILLHIPRAVADPNSGDGNEITSVFQAIAFSAIAFLIARIAGKKRFV